MTKDHSVREEIETGNFRIVEHEGLFAVQKEVILVTSRFFVATNWLWGYSELLHSIQSDKPEWQFCSIEQEGGGKVNFTKTNNGLKFLCIATDGYDHCATYVLVHDTLLEAQGEKIGKEKRFMEKLKEGKELEWKEVSYEQN